MRDNPVIPAWVLRGVTALEAYQAPAGYWKMSAALGPTRVPDESKGQDATLKAS